ncbi:acyl-CoA dehydrogenase [Ignatzschineria indica]|uniref:Acyl-CoA dehydrogenase n=1 Tax=Ignatzschineria indica TaxID=472583 RepID=A0A2U2AIY4_9GAMM|nr:acyl-CoA dehydrogenase family protein [Ignatzschineria indica]PWD82630.1 acyl-CoA dehydrogenase [Ignatzschineria indica]GGZ85424.1 acyl-CoA dehydrogenase [Ignatzschineria indica]
MIRDKEMLTLLLDSINSFVDKALKPIEATVSKHNKIPDEIISQFKEMGLFGFAIPEEYEGLGLTMEEEVNVAFALGQTSPAFRSLIGTNNGIGAQGIILDGTPEQKAFYLPKLASGEFISAFCLTEPDSGSDAGSLKTRAQKDGDEYIINGTKRFITNAPIADIFTVMARTNPDIKGSGGISAFIIHKDTPGVIIGSPDEKMGQEGALTSDVIFDNCRIPASQIIGGIEGLGFKTAMKVLDKGRLHIAAICVGVAERMLNDALNYALERKQFGQEIAHFQLIQAMLADSKAEIYAAKCMVIDAAQKRDEGLNVNTEASCAKMFSSEMCGRVADRAVQIFGGAGYSKEYSIERFYRDVRLFRIYEGTTQIQQLVIAKNMIRAALGK